ncbi:unnamed protein product, partial [Porites lobata]
SEERKKKSGAAWKVEEDEKLNKSRAFVELTEYRTNAVDNDTHFFILAELHIKLYSLQTEAHTLQSRYSFAFSNLDAKNHHQQSLGVVFDDNLLFDAHVSAFFCRLSFHQLRNLSKIRKCLTRESSEIAVHAFITSKTDY